MAVPDVLKMIQDNEVKFVDLRFTDTRGKEQHVTLPGQAFDADKLEMVMHSMVPRLRDGKAFRPPTCC